MALFASNDLGIDLGTANIIVYCRGRGIVLREPSVVAVSTDSRREVLAIGEEAKTMLGKTPGTIEAIKPLQDGVIADFDITEILLRYIMRKVSAYRLMGLAKPCVVICVPCGVTEVEKRAVEEATRHAGAREAYLVEEPFAAAIGAGLPIHEPLGSMVVDIGGGTTEIAVISYGGIAVSESLRMGGNKMDEAIMAYLKKEHNIAVGEHTAEDIKMQLGAALPLKEPQEMPVRGLDLINGLPGVQQITSVDVFEALREPVMAIIDVIKVALERTPPELMVDIMQRGIVLTGGGALLRGLDLLIHQETGLPVYVADNPMDCVAIGAGKIVEEIEYFKRSSSMLR